MSSIRITSEDQPDLDLEVPLGEGPPVVAGGVGGWEEIQRPDDVSLTDWAGVEPLKLAVPVMLDGWRDSSSVQPVLDQLFRLAGRASGTQVRQGDRLRVTGPVPFSGQVVWVINAIEQGDDVIWDGEILVRQSLTLQFLEYVEPDTIVFNPGMNQKGSDLYKKVERYRAKKGDNLISIAVKFFKDKSMWKAIAKLNEKNKNVPRDPRKPIPQGTWVLLPPPPKKKKQKTKKK